MLSSDEELVEALNHQKDGIFRLFVSRQSASPPTNADVHKNVVCDGCQGEVRGNRYKCVVCPDYDLCSKCEFAGKHLEHNMMCVRQPVNPCDWGFWRDFAMQMNAQMPSSAHHPPPPPPPPAAGRPPPPGYYPPWGGAGYPWQCRKMWKKAFKCHQRLQRENSRIRESAAYGNTNQSPMPTESNDAKPDEEPNQRQCADTHKEFLKTMGEAVQSMLDPFGIDVSFSVDGSTGSATSKPSSTEAASTKKCNNEVVVDVDKEEKAAKSSQEMNVDLDSTPSSPEAQKTAEFIIIDDPDDVVETSPGAKKLPPKVVHSLELMKRMGFKDDGGWLTKLLLENDGNIDKVLDIFQTKFKH